ncbi:LysR family transcriptional regulator [Pigmentiphaga litoralis]|uniref:LysR family transcriptional regulator n=1 Tax=Pigmentiphaga litoralis TaxID=516702 RepID=UPI0016764A56|nr:LysR family transcriptional regulator [Pigmentiphaga litoralis]GGX00062.1 LysR family transcriptional regulator [Pigmentiphaga litoralis]
MELRQLECFVRVVELGSVTRAAITLNLSQPVVSRHVRQLEVELKEHLLSRNGRGVSPTDAGRRLLERGKGILHQVELAKQEVEEQRASPSGKVVVGMPPSVGKAMTVNLVTQFREHFPKASLGVIEALTVSMHEWLLLGRLDFALLYNPPISQQVISEHVWSEDLYLIGADVPHRPMPAEVPMAELPAWPVIVPSQPNALRNLAEVECARLGVKLNITLEVDSIESLLDLVDRGMGYAILSRNAILGRAQRPNLRAAHIVSPNLGSRLVIASSAQRPLTRLAQGTMELIKAQILAGGLQGDRRRG